MSSLTNIVLDAETYYDDEFSLRKMATSTYIRDPRFHEHGWGVQIEDGKPVWFSRAEFAYFAKQFNWKKARIIGHNLAFDGTILAIHHNVRPAEWCDTLGMAKAVICERSSRFGLDHLAKYIGRQGKVRGKSLDNVKGIRAPSASQMQQLAAYCLDDVRDTYALWQYMWPFFPEKERWVLDWSIRMFTEPKLLLDRDVFASLHEEELERKDALFESLPYTKKQLASNDQFADILRDLGEEPPVKVSKATGKQTYAFAKNDIAFNTMVEEATGLLADVLEARLAAKSTITVTRSARYRDLADEGPWCVPLNYAGAKQTKRFCLVGDTKIVVYRGNDILETDITNLRHDDLVWDGVAFVVHGGLAPAGIKEVMCYDGIEGTKDHRVFIAPPGEQPRFVELAEAAEAGHGICRGEAPVGYRFEAGRLRAGSHGREGADSVPRLQRGKGDESSRYPCFPERSLPELCIQGEDAGSEAEAHRSQKPQGGQRSSHCASQNARSESVAQCSGHVPYCETEVHQSEQQPLGVVWGARDRVPFLVSGSDAGLCVVDAGASPQGYGHRPDRQRGPLRGRQPEVGNDTAIGGQSPQLQRLAPTYDIVDCGPRNQFVANGRIVHNSGGQKQNAQNLSSRGPAAKIRNGIMAPPGHVIYVIDSSNIELRTNAVMSGQWDVMDRLIAKQDEYAKFAGDIYGRAIDKEKDKKERNVGKVAVLSLGYQSGAGTYRGMLRAQQGILLPIEQCQEVVTTYRRAYPHIVRNWKQVGNRIKMLADGLVPENLDTNPPIEWFVGPDGQAGVRSLYSGSLVEWNDLRYEMLESFGERRKALVYTKSGTGFTTIYGGKGVENISQFLAREVINYQTYEIFKGSGFRPQLQVHDELVFVIPEAIATEFDAFAMQCMSGPVPWWPELVTAAEASIVYRYGEAKG